MCFIIYSFLIHSDIHISQTPYFSPKTLLREIKLIQFLILWFKEHMSPWFSSYHLPFLSVFSYLTVGGTGKSWLSITCSQAGAYFRETQTLLSLDKKCLSLTWVSSYKGQSQDSDIFSVDCFMVIRNIFKEEVVIRKSLMRVPVNLTKGNSVWQQKWLMEQ